MIFFGERVEIYEDLEIEGKKVMVQYIFPRKYKPSAMELGPEMTTVGRSRRPATGALREAMIARLQALEPLVAGMRR